jgi:enamine deaminase RidA (YjgF/YER057c/UK114 family)
MKQVQPDGWERARGYSHGIVGEGLILAVAGQIGWNPRTHVFEAKDFVGQTRQALQNVAAVLQAAGTGPHHVG